jgi:transaldolase
MRIFLDTGNIEAIKKGVDSGLITGVTTNPTHIMKTGRKFLDVVTDICAIVPGPVSVEAMAESAEDLIEEAKKISTLASNIAVKIPMTVEGLKAVPILTKEYNIKTNVTMVFSSTQAFLAMMAGSTFVSLVLSRLDAIANESDILTEDAVLIKHNYGFKSEVLAASLKTQNHVLLALRSGVDIISIPDTLFFQMYKHPLTDAGLNQFKNDWIDVPK